MSYNNNSNPNEIARTLVGQNSDGEFDYIARDDFSGAMPVIDEAHHRVHLGEAYFSGYYDNAVLNAGTVTFLYVTGVSNFPHIVTSVSVSGDATIELFEGVTTTDDGTPVPTYNRNRNSLNTSTLTLFHTPVVSDFGTAFPSDFIPAGTKKKASGGSDGFGDELIFKPETKYLLRVTNVSGATEIVSLSPGGYNW